jgi:mRNA-degrading endonuclease toxin of MazEF toxin-antitoxin module
MRALKRGEVIFVKYPNGFDTEGNPQYKPRRVVVLYDTKKDDSAVTVYCTSQNNGDDEYNILVDDKSEEGKNMGLDKPTYIRPKDIKTFPVEALIRPVGKCSLMDKIQAIIEKIKAKGR